MSSLERNFKKLNNISRSWVVSSLLPLASCSYGSRDEVIKSVIPSRPMPSQLPCRPARVTIIVNRTAPPTLKRQLCCELQSVFFFSFFLYFIFF